MGTALEVISVVLSNGIALGGLLLAVAAWRDSRGSGATTRIERDGVSITMQDASPETIRRVTEALLNDQPEAVGKSEVDESL